MNKSIYLLIALSLGTTSFASERELFDDGWKFALGNAADPVKDFGCGTEYFNYLTKANSVHNIGPYSPNFSTDSCGVWVDVTLPHDWVVDLPFDREASHSHGYKTVGYSYPETSVGWYRKSFFIPEEDLGRHISLQFDGIFRDARLWVNGFYLGSEPSGYATQVYEISDYLNYGGDNVVAVRADASLEEGWFYEGGGIYRHVWIDKANPLHVAPFGTFIHADLKEPYEEATVSIETTVDNMGLQPADYVVRYRLIAPDGTPVAIGVEASESGVQAKTSRTSTVSFPLASPALWDTDNPQLYTLVTEIVCDGEVVDTRTETTGFRDIRFDPDQGFFLNGRHVKLKGANMHQDHPGVGAAIPDALQAYRLRELKKLGVNAYRASHNPMSPAMLDACDSMGVLVIEENRLTGINDEHIRLLRRMIERDRNRPSIILWSIGNEEWGTEWNDYGRRISATMTEYCHRFDPTRPVTIATSSGPTVLVPVDVAGYNYILQNPIERLREEYPDRIAVGTEETSGCGARGIYFDDHANGLMKAINRAPSGPDSLVNAIERGWKFYDERPWTAGVFYWTGFDYRGEANPMVYPSTGSQFGILDYCGFPKDEAFYLKSWWTDEPVLHIFPHWNLAGHEGETIDLMAYSNMDEVELFVNGESLGRKSMPRNGHLSWQAIYEPGEVLAVGYKNGEKAMETRVATTGKPARLELTADRPAINGDGRDVAVMTVRVLDADGRAVPDANVPLSMRVEGAATILGAGNGNPAFLVPERPSMLPEAERLADNRTFTIPTFNGLAQVLIQSLPSDIPQNAVLTVSSPDCHEACFELKVRSID